MDLSWRRLKRRDDALQDINVAFGSPGRATHEKAVDVRLSHQIGGVAAVDAAAVEDLRLMTEDFGGRALDQGLLLVGVVRRGRDALIADGPDRFVGEEEMGGLLAGSELG
jgi:hypothetical protein